MSHYEELGIEQSATAAQVKAAYRRLAHRYHPDKPSGDRERFVRIQRAYDTLSDPDKRAFYDQNGADREGPTMRERAMQTLAMMFGQVVGAEQNDIEHHDLIDYMRTSIIRAREEIPEKRRGIERQIQRFKTARARLRQKSAGPNPLGEILDARVMQLKQAIVALESEVELGTVMLELLEDYHYEVATRASMFVSAAFASLASNTHLT